MKGNKIKIITIILVIFLIALIAFFGVYIQKQNRMEDQVKKYSYAMDINGARNVILKPSTGTKKVVKDSEGKIVEQTSTELTDEQIVEKGYTKEETKYNQEDALNKENYEKSKKVIDERLKELKIDNYLIRLNEETGEITIEIAENTNTDSIVSNIATVGKFEIVDSETQEVLMNNSDIKEVKVMYGSDSQSTQSTGTNVYLDIEFNKEGTKKLENITGTYTNTAGTQNTTENTTSDTTATSEKKITMKIDDETIMSTSFDSIIRTGKLQLTYGTASKDTTKVNENAKKANNMATILNNGNMPIKYEVENNKYVLSDINEKSIQKVEIGVLIIAGIALIILIFRYKINGLLGAISFIGLGAVYLLLIRYTNVILSLEGIFAIITVLALNYIFIDKLLNNINKNNKEEQKLNNINEITKRTYKNFFVRIIPVIIMSIVFCFITWIPISSFGMVTFWGIALIFVFNNLITKTLLKLRKTDKTQGGTGNETK